MLFLQVDQHQNEIRHRCHWKKVLGKGKSHFTSNNIKRGNICRLIKSANIWKRLHYKKPIERKLSNIASLNRHKNGGKKIKLKKILTRDLLHKMRRYIKFQHWAFLLLFFYDKDPPNLEYVLCSSWGDLSVWK